MRCLEYLPGRLVNKTTGREIEGMHLPFAMAFRTSSLAGGPSVPLARKLEGTTMKRGSRLLESNDEERLVFGGMDTDHDHCIVFFWQRKNRISRYWASIWRVACRGQGRG